MLITYLTGFLTVVALFLAAYFDWRFTRIPNWLTFPMWIYGLLAGFLAEGKTGLIDHSTGLLVGLLLLLLPYLMGGMGAGDVKFLAGIGAMQGWRFVFGAMFNGALIGGLVAFTVLLRHRAFKSRFKSFWSNLRQLIIVDLLTLRKIPEPEDTPAGPQEQTIPYGVALATGALISFFWNPLTLIRL